jgi:hypothetical protein
MKRVLTRSALLAVALACGWQATVAAPVLAQRGEGTPRPDPTELWEAYPLKPRAQPLPATKPAPPAKKPTAPAKKPTAPAAKPTPPAATTRVAAPQSSDGQQSSGGQQSAPLLLVAAVLALAMLAGGVSWFKWRTPVDRGRPSSP